MQIVEITFTVPVMLADDVAEKLITLVHSSVMRPEEPASWLKIEIIDLAQKVLPIKILAHFERYCGLLDAKAAV